MKRTRKRKSTAKSKVHKPAKRRRTLGKPRTKKMSGLKKARLKKTIESLKSGLKHLEKEISR